MDGRREATWLRIVKMDVGDLGVVECLRDYRTHHRAKDDLSVNHHVAAVEHTNGNQTCLNDLRHFVDRQLGLLCNFPHEDRMGRLIWAFLWLMCKIQKDDGLPYFCIRHAHTTGCSRF